VSGSELHAGTSGGSLQSCKDGSIGVGARDRANAAIQLEGLDLKESLATALFRITCLRLKAINSRKSPRRREFL
jgi:hypothetical protein